MIDLTPQQVNEKIKDLLKSEREKPKYAMMDAWNNCPDIRKDVLLNHIVPKNKEESFDLSYMISRQGKYLWHGLNDETLKDHTKLEFWKEYDRIYGTNYADDVEKTIKRNKIYSETISVINGMDFSQIHKQSW